MTRIQVRRDTSANWASVNPTPAEGEPCFETDTGKLKIGNGQQPYNSLPYQTAEEIPVATTSTAGLVKPDGTTITITPDGTISSAGGALPDNVVTTDTVQTITARKTFSVGTPLRFGSDTSSASIKFTSSPKSLVVDGDELIGGMKVNTTLTCSNLIVNGLIRISQNKDAIRYESTGDKIVIGDDTNIEIVSTNAPTIVRNSQTYTNIDSGNLQPLLDGKVNSADMVEVPVVVEQSDKSLMPSWYRVWSNGWIEQGGQISVTNTTTVNLLKPYTQTNYLPNAQAIGQSTGNQTSASVSPINVNSFSITSSASTAQDFNWYCVGY